MNNKKGFLDIARKEACYVDVEKRILNYLPVEIPLSWKEAATQAARCMECGIPFCHGYGCPLGNLIPEWNYYLASSHWQMALRILLSTNDFPEFTSRVCPAPCEDACVASLATDAVSIRQIERLLVDRGFAEKIIKPQKTHKKSGKSVAVIGSGPAGLVVANHLNRLGHKVSVFEKSRECGGLLMYGIPDFKLEKEVVRKRIEIMRQEGVIFENNVDVANDVMPSYFKKHFHAICLATGADVPNKLNVVGSKLKGIHFAMDFLTNQNKALSHLPIKKSLFAKGKRVVVIGGGDTGADCVGVAIRQKAKSVLQLEIMPKPPQVRSIGTPWPLWAYRQRYSSSQKEGSKQEFSILTKKFNANKQGDVCSIETKKVAWEFTEYGLPKSFFEVDNSRNIVLCDLVILAMGFKKSEKLIKLFKEELNTSQDARKLFWCGDLKTGASLVVKAMADGKQTAVQIDNYLKNS